jgi:hypothetical protein
MVKSLIINVALHTPQNKLSDTITHVTLNTINNVVFLLSCGNENVTSLCVCWIGEYGLCFTPTSITLYTRPTMVATPSAAAPAKSWLLLSKSWQWWAGLAIEFEWVIWERPAFHIRATSHTRLQACDHYTSSTLIGGKGRAGPSSLHTTVVGRQGRHFHVE